MLSHLGAMVSVVNGVLFARRMKGLSGMVGVTCLGDGATSTVHSTRRSTRPPLKSCRSFWLWPTTNTPIRRPTSRQFACADLVDKAAGYGINPHSVDGTDLAACLRIVGDAINRARAGDGPQLVVAKLLRLCGHGEHDPTGDILQTKDSYLDPKLINSPLSRDCLKVAEELLFREKILDAVTLATWRSQIIHEIEDAVATAQREPAPDPFAEDWRALSSENLIETHLENSAR